MGNQTQTYYNQEITIVLGVIMAIGGMALHFQDRQKKKKREGKRMGKKETLSLRDT